MGLLSNDATNRSLHIQTTSPSKLSNPTSFNQEMISTNTTVDEKSINISSTEAEEVDITEMMNASGEEINDIADKEVNKADNVSLSSYSEKGVEGNKGNASHTASGHTANSGNKGYDTPNNASKVDSGKNQNSASKDNVNNNANASNTSAGTNKNGANSTNNQKMHTSGGKNNKGYDTNKSNNKTTSHNASGGGGSTKAGSTSGSGGNSAGAANSASASTSRGSSSSSTNTGGKSSSSRSGKSSGKGKGVVYRKDAKYEQFTLRVEDYDPEVQEIINNFRAYGLYDLDIQRLLNGEISLDELLLEISNDPVRQRRLYEAGMLHNPDNGLGKTFNNVEELDDYIKILNQELTELIEGRKKLVNNVPSVYERLLELTKRGMSVENASKSVVVYWKSADGTIVEIDPVRVENAAKMMKQGYTPVKLADVIKEDPNSEYAKEYQKVLAAEKNGEDLSKLQEQYAKEAKEIERKLTVRDNRISRKLAEIQKFEYFKEQMKINVDHQLYDIDPYINKEDFDKNNSFPNGALDAVLNAKDDHQVKGTFTVKKADTADVIACLINGYGDEISITALTTADNDFIEAFRKYCDIEYETVDENGNTVTQKGVFTEEEKQIFNYIYNTEGKDAALAYAKQITDAIDNRWLQVKTLEDSKKATSSTANKVLYSVGSIFATPLEGIQAVYYSTNAVYQQKVHGKDVDILRANVYSAGSTWRNAVSQSIAASDQKNQTHWAFWYDIGMSMADSATLIAASAATGGAATPVLSASLMGSRAYVTTLNDCLDRGMSDGKAVTLAWSSAAVETLMESYSTGHLLNLEKHLGVATEKLVMKAGSKFTDPLMKKIAQKLTLYAAGSISQGLAEGEEEFATEILNYVFDGLIGGDLSDSATAVERYRKLGYTDEQIEKALMLDLKERALQAFIGGFVSGIFFGAAGSTKISRRSSYAIANNMYTELQGTTDSENLGKILEQDRKELEAYENALKKNEEYQKAVAKGQDTTNLELTEEEENLLKNGTTAMQVDAARKAEAKAKRQEKIDNIKNKLKDKSGKVAMNSSNSSGSSQSGASSSNQSRTKTTETKADTKKANTTTQSTKTNTSQAQETSTDTQTNTSQVQETSTDARTNTSQVQEASTDTRTNTSQVQETSADVRTNTDQVQEASTDTKTNTSQVQETSADVRTNTDQVQETSADARTNTDQVQETSTDTRTNQTTTPTTTPVNPAIKPTTKEATTASTIAGAAATSAAVATSTGSSSSSTSTGERASTREETTQRTEPSNRNVQVASSQPNADSTTRTTPSTTTPTLKQETTDKINPVEFNSVLNAIANNNPGFKTMIDSIKLEIKQSGNVITDPVISKYTELVDQLLGNSNVNASVLLFSKINELTEMYSFKQQSDGSYSYSPVQKSNFDAVKDMLQNKIYITDSYEKIDDYLNQKMNELRNAISQAKLNDYYGTPEFMQEYAEYNEEAVNTLLESKYITEEERTTIASYIDTLQSIRGNINSYDLTSPTTEESYRNIEANFKNLKAIEQKLAKINMTAWQRYFDQTGNNFIHCFTGDVVGLEEFNSTKICTALSIKGKTNLDAFGGNGAGIIFNGDFSAIDSLKPGDAGSWDGTKEIFLNRSVKNDIGNQYINGSDITYDDGKHSILLSPDSIEAATNMDSVDEVKSEIVFRNKGIQDYSYFVSDLASPEDVKKVYEIATKEGKRVEYIDSKTNERRVITPEEIDKVLNPKLDSNKNNNSVNIVNNSNVYEQIDQIISYMDGRHPEFNNYGRDQVAAYLLTGDTSFITSKYRNVIKTIPRSEILDYYQSKGLDSIFDNIRKALHNRKNTTSTTTETQTQSEIVMDPVHGYQLNMNNIGNFYKAQLRAGTITVEELNELITRINSQGYMSKELGEYLGDLFNNSDYTIYRKTINSENLDSIFEKGIYYLGYKSGAGGAFPMTEFNEIMNSGKPNGEAYTAEELTEISQRLIEKAERNEINNELSLDAVIAKVHDIIEASNIIKNPREHSEGSNTVNGTLILKIPKGYTKEDIFYRMEDGGFAVKPEFIEGFVGADEQGNLTELQRRVPITASNNSDSIKLIDSSKATIIDVASLDMNQKMSLVKGNVNLNRSYEGYDYVVKPQTSLKEVLDSIKDTKQKVLIELNGVEELDPSLFENIPDNISFRISNYNNSYAQTDSILYVLNHLTYNAQELKIISSKLNEIKSGIDDNFTDYQKAEYVYNYLRDNIKYNPNPGGNVGRGKEYDGLSSLIVGESTCEGFAHTYRMILNSLGIECEEVWGHLNHQGKHAFTIVKIGDETMLVDPVRELLNNTKGTGFGVDLDYVKNEYSSSPFQHLLAQVNSENKELGITNSVVIKASNENYDTIDSIDPKKFKELSLEEQLSIINNTNIYKLSYLLNIDMAEECKEAFVQRIKNNMDLIALNKYLNSFGTIKSYCDYILNNLSKFSEISDQQLLMILDDKFKDNVEIKKEIINRINSGSTFGEIPSVISSMFGLKISQHNAKISLIYEMLDESQLEILKNNIKNKIMNNIPEDIRKKEYGTYNQQLLIADLYLKGKFNNQSLELLNRLFESHESIGKTFDFGMLDSDIINDFGEQFIVDIGNYPELCRKIIYLKEHSPNLYDIYIKMVEQNNKNSSLGNEFYKNSLELDYLFNNQEILQDVNINNIDIDNFLNYILYRKNNESFKLFSVDYSTNFKEEIYQKCDEMYNEIVEKYHELIGNNSEDNKKYQEIFGDKATDMLRKSQLEDILSDLKKVYLQKYFSMDNETVNKFINIYSNIEQIKENVSPDDYQIVSDSIDILSKLRAMDTNDIETIFSLYDNQSISFDYEEIMSIQETMRRAFNKLYVTEFEKTKNKIEQATTIQHVNHNGKDIKVVELDGDFSMLVHSNFSGFVEGEKEFTNYKDDWIKTYDPKGHGLSTSFTSNEFFGAPPVVGNGVLYGFYDVGSNDIYEMAPYDLNSHIANYGFKSGNNQLYMSPQEMANASTRIYNEFVLSRADSKPSCVIIYENATEENINSAYQAASDWDIPVVKINRETIAREQMVHIKQLIDEFKQTNDYDKLKEAIQIYERGTSSLRLNIVADTGTIESITNSDTQSFNEIYDSSEIIEILNSLVDNETIAGRQELLDVLKKINASYEITNENGSNNIQKTQSLLGISDYITKLEQLISREDIESVDSNGYIDKWLENAKEEQKQLENERQSITDNQNSLESTMNTILGRAQEMAPNTNYDFKYLLNNISNIMKKAGINTEVSAKKKGQFKFKERKIYLNPKIFNNEDVSYTTFMHEFGHALYEICLGKHKFTTKQVEILTKARENYKLTEERKEILKESSKRITEAEKNVTEQYEKIRQQEEEKIKKFVQEFYDNNDIDGLMDYINELGVEEGDLDLSLSIEENITNILNKNNQVMKELEFRDLLSSTDYLEDRFISGMLNSLLADNSILNLGDSEYEFWYAHPNEYYVFHKDFLSFHELVADYFLLKSINNQEITSKIETILGKDVIELLDRTYGDISYTAKKVLTSKGNTRFLTPEQSRNGVYYSPQFLKNMFNKNKTTSTSSYELIDKFIETINSSYSEKPYFGEVRLLAYALTEDTNYINFEDASLTENFKDNIANISVNTILDYYHSKGMNSLIEKTKNKLLADKKIKGENIINNLSSTTRDFISKFNFDVQSFMTDPNNNVKTTRDINPIISSYGVFDYVNENTTISAADLVGYDFNSQGKNILSVFEDYYDKTIPGKYDYKNRSIGFLDFQSGTQFVAFIKDLAEKKFDYMRINEIANDKYVISSNGLHRFAVLRFFYLLDRANKVRSEEELREMYKIPVNIEYKVNLKKSYCNYLITRYNKDYLEILFDKDKIIINPDEINSEEITEEQLLTLAKQTIQTVDEKQLSEIIHFYTTNNSFHEFIDRNIPEILYIMDKMEGGTVTNDKTNKVR